MKHAWFAFVLIVVVCCGCQVVDKVSTGEKPNSIAGVSTYFFSDRKHSGMEYGYFFRGDELFVRVVHFPGYENPKWYSLNKVPDDLIGPLRQWINHPGCESSSLHEWYSRITYPSNTNYSRQVVCFPARTPIGDEIGKWFLELRKMTVKARYRVRAIPHWIKDDSRIDKRYGLGGEPKW